MKFCYYMSHKVVWLVTVLTTNTFNMLVEAFLLLKWRFWLNNIKLFSSKWIVNIFWLLAWKDFIMFFEIFLIFPIFACCYVFDFFFVFFTFLTFWLRDVTVSQCSAITSCDTTGSKHLILIWVLKIDFSYYIFMCI